MRDTIDVILFDWGGTIVNADRQRQTYGPCTTAAVAALRAAGVAVPDAAADNLTLRFGAVFDGNDPIDNLREFDAEAFLQAWSRDHAVDLPAATLPTVLQALWRPWIGCLDPLGDAVNSVHALHRAGFVLGLVSNCATAPDACRQEVQRQGIASALAFTLFSSELGIRKPHPLMYQAAMERARAALNGQGGAALSADAVLFVGDTPAADIDGPGEMGMRTALVRSGCWTGDPGMLGRTPDLILDSIDDLPTLLA